jgi:hypothetical protein
LSWASGARPYPLAIDPERSQPTNLPEWRHFTLARRIRTHIGFGLFYEVIIDRAEARDAHTVSPVESQDRKRIDWQPWHRW